MAPEKKKATKKTSKATKAAKGAVKEPKKKAAKATEKAAGKAEKPAAKPKKSARSTSKSAESTAKKKSASAASSVTKAAGKAAKTTAKAVRKTAQKSVQAAAKAADKLKEIAPVEIPKTVVSKLGRPEYCDGTRPDEFTHLLHCTTWDPHRLLGVHEGEYNGERGLIIRAWHPDVEGLDVVIEETNELLPMKELDTPGVWGAWLPGRDFPFTYKLRYRFGHGREWLTYDPYRFMPSLGDVDLYLHGEGTHLKAYTKFGAQLTEMGGVTGVTFCVWAPSAQRVSVVGSFNNWDGRIHPMRSMGSSGVWELFVPGLKEGDEYKYEILTRDRHLRYKADPYSFAFDLRPSSHSKVVDLSKYQWNDSEYMTGLPEREYIEGPMSVYEVHLGSWMRCPEEGNRWLNYRELAERLVPHVQRYGFTHIELLPVAEHPFDGSWGYQVTGYFAPTSRFGSPDDFKYFVDYCHQHGIGVIIDWVPAHFPRDDFALRWFDGTALYEYADPRRGEHKDWGTLIFNYGRNEVRNFLLSNALFWLDEYHVDGLRVDAVASMLYLDYSRKPGEWLPNEYGGNENLEAISFLRQMNTIIHGEYPGRFTVAEESTAFPGVSKPIYSGGLGFTFKWNMGWMNDTLRYFSRDAIFRKYHQNDLTFSMVYQYSENFLLPFSHDEVVHGKGSLLGKMPGDDWQKFANLRLLYAYMYAHPGKKLLFMGAEFGQGKEWQCDSSLDWHLGRDPLHKGIDNSLQALGWTYRHNEEFWHWDSDPQGFRWIDFSDHANSVVSWARFGPRGHVVCVFNFTPIPRLGYRVGMPANGRYREIFNSDSGEFGGSNIGNHGQVFTQDVAWHGFDQSAHINIPPNGAVFFKHEW